MDEFDETSHYKLKFALLLRMIKCNLSDTFDSNIKVDK